MTTRSEWEREIARARSEIKARLWRAAQLLAIAAAALCWRLADDDWGPKGMVYTTFVDVGIHKVVVLMEIGIIALAAFNAMLSVLIARNLYRLLQLRTGRSM